jgi:rhomboid protease GluP
MNILERLLKALGFDITRLRWRYHRWREGWSKRRQRLENRRKPFAYKHKVCGECGALADRTEPVCPRCGRRLPSVLLNRLQRMARLIIPQGNYVYTIAILLLNFALYAAMLVRGEGGGGGLLNSGVDGATLIRFGAWSVPLVAEGEVWRLVCSVFLHVDLMHIGFNCLWLVQLGPMVEESFGRSRFLALYLLSGIGGFVASVLYRWHWAAMGIYTPGAGASGAVFGLIATALILGYLRKFPGATAYREGLLKWAILGLILSFIPGVDLAAHLGGAVVAGVMALFLAPEGQARRLPKRFWLLVEVVCLMVIGVSLFAAANNIPAILTR